VPQRALLNAEEWLGSMMLLPEQVPGEAGGEVSNSAARVDCTGRRWVRNVAHDRNQLLFVQMSGWGACGSVGAHLRRLMLPSLTETTDLPSVLHSTYSILPSNFPVPAPGRWTRLTSPIPKLLVPGFQHDSSPVSATIVFVVDGSWPFLWQ